MSDIKDLAELVTQKWQSGWSNKARQCFEGIRVGSRYEKKAEKATAIRSPDMAADGTSVPYAAYINPANPDSGAYGGISFVIFPFAGGPSLIAFGVGTQGLAPDERVLGRPGHARKLAAICTCVNEKFGKGKRIAWAKNDPCRTDLDLPESVKEALCPCPIEPDESVDKSYAKAIEKYGSVIYAAVNPAGLSKADVEIILKMFLDVYFEECGIKVKGQSNKTEAEDFRKQYQAHLFPAVSKDQMKKLLDMRHFAIVEGPPGTGKTRVATQLSADYADSMSIQFHPNMTYEQFVGGLFPVQDSGSSTGFSFKPHPGYLMTAIQKAKDLPPGKKFLLHIDEINRADLSRVLGEAIMLFEPKADTPRSIELNYDFPDVVARKLSVPENLHVIGTMNSADRSIAILDIAIRRRFAFVQLYPQMKVVVDNGDAFSQLAFSKLLTIFVEKATNENFKYMPGHSYFIKGAGAKDTRLQIETELLPLLREYIEQGYVAGFADDIAAYIQEYEILCRN